MKKILFTIIPINHLILKHIRKFRSINASDRVRSAFNSCRDVVGKHHPSLYAFFEELKKEQKESEGLLRQLGLGQRIRRVTEKKRREREQEISNLVHDCDEYHTTLIGMYRT